MKAPAKRTLAHPDGAKMATSKPGPHGAKTKKKLHRIEINRAKGNNGLIVRHSFDNSGDGPYQDSEEHAFNDHAAAVEHLGSAMKAMGIKSNPLKSKPAQAQETD